MPRPQKNDHAHVDGMVWATRVTSIAMQMAVPTGLGYLADQRWGLTPWLMIVGACLGGAMFAMEVVRLAQGVEAGESHRSAVLRKQSGSRKQSASRKQGDSQENSGSGKNPRSS